MGKQAQRARSPAIRSSRPRLLLHASQAAKHGSERQQLADDAAITPPTTHTHTHPIAPSIKTARGRGTQPPVSHVSLEKRRLEKRHGNEALTLEEQPEVAEHGRLLASREQHAARLRKGQLAS